MILIVVSLVVFGCQALSRTNGTAAEEPSSVAAARLGAASEVEVRRLRFDETQSFGPLRLRWLDSNDSRCPLGVQCVWAGQVVTTVEASRDDRTPQSVELTLRPGVEPGAQTAAGHELRLLSVEPYPRESVTPKRSEYVATIEIRPL